MAAADPASRPARRQPTSRLAMFARLVARSLSVSAARLGVPLGAIIIGAAVVSALTSLYFDISAKMSEELRAYGANFIVTPRAADGVGEGRGIDVAILEKAAQALPPGRLVGSSPFLYGVARLDVGPAVVVGVDFNGLKAISPYWQVEGSWVGAAFDERNAMVGRALAKSMGLKVGSAVNIVNRGRTARAQVVVKAVVDTGEAEDNQMFVNLALAHRLFAMPGKADFLMASVVAQGAEADRLAAAMMNAVPQVEARPIRKISQNDGQILDKIQGLMAVVALIILIITTLCVSAALSALVAERAPEIGLQKALGASDRSVVAQFLAETSALSLFGAAVGLVLGYALAQALGQAVFGDWVSFRPVVVPLTLALSLAAGLAAAVLPVRGAIAVSPAAVLRGE